MAIATVVSGIAMALVHTLSKKLPNAEYAAFGALLPVLLWMGLPAIGLQPTFAKQTAEALTAEKKAEMAAAFRAVMLGTFAVWLATAIGMIACQHQILQTLKVGRPLALWLTVVAGLGILWLPIVQGVLQGRENFGWLGGMAILNGMGRLGVSVAIVACGGMAAGIIAGTLIGLALATGTGLWLVRDLWGVRPARFNWQAWLRTVVPLTVGCGVCQFMQSADPIFVQSHFHDTAPYMFGGTLARAIVIMASSLTAVMFPKVVASLARGRKTDVVAITLIETLVLGFVAAEGLRIAAPLAIRILSKPEYASFLPFIHRYALAMVPLCLANVLISDLLARGKFRCVPWLGAVALGYWEALQHFHTSFGTVITILGCANLTLLATCVVFRQMERRK